MGGGGGIQLRGGALDLGARRRLPSGDKHPRLALETRSGGGSCRQPQRWRGSAARQSGAAPLRASGVALWWDGIGEPVIMGGERELEDRGVHGGGGMAPMAG
ncbi:hypothetical protein E2562_018637 [Oryza meyeriana var. granulata]|uniref:DUF834 domain-containing protein n=1 Tax=Oryza meyeriana var. granulata TaxID=110450 RepID=A0A6G1BY60_9ORYZ|nr:hypothetical protein E2562_018637 [Oryza meyeriana var. granulata]